MVFSDRLEALVQIGRGFHAALMVEWYTSVQSATYLDDWAARGGRGSSEQFLPVHGVISWLPAEG
jgi:hypothetical protein